MHPDPGSVLSLGGAGKFYMSKFVLLAACAATLLVAASPARAVDADGPDCSGFGRDSEGNLIDALIAACSRGRIDRQIMTHTQDALAVALARSFHIEDEAQEPADLDEASEPDESNAGAAVGSNARAHPVADVPASVEDLKWNSWIDGKYTYDDANHIALNQDGGVWNGLAGIDYKLTSRFTIGLLGSVEGSDLKGPVSSLNTSGVGIGPYIGYTLGDHIVLSSSLIGATIDTDQADTSGSFHFSSNRLQATAGATGYWYVDGIRLSPGLSASWSKEWLHETSGTAVLPDHDVEVGMLTSSFQMGRTFTLSNGTTVEPWAGGAWDWTFLNRVKYSGLPAMDAPTKDARLQAGLNFGFGKHAQLALTGEIGGLVNTSVRTYAAEANFAFQF